MATKTVDAVLTMAPAPADRWRPVSVIGIPCRVYALRALEEELGLERLFVIGTPFSDTTTIQQLHAFLAMLDPAPETIGYLEFHAHYHVELRFTDGRKRLEVPFLKLPISKLPPDSSRLTCCSCVDDTNVLADISVGSMGGEGEQWLHVRNARARSVDAAGPRAAQGEPGSNGKRQGSVRGSKSNVERPPMGWPMPKIGFKDLEFARARPEM